MKAHLFCMTPHSCPWIWAWAGGSEVSQGVHGCVGGRGYVRSAHTHNRDQPGSWSGGLAGLGNPIK